MHSPCYSRITQHITAVLLHGWQVANTKALQAGDTRSQAAGAASATASPSQSLGISPNVTLWGDCDLTYRGELGLTHTDVTRPFQSSYLPSLCQPICSASLHSLHKCIPAFLLIFPQQPISNVFSSCSHSHSPWFPPLFSLQLSTPSSSHLWLTALHILSSTLLISSKLSLCCSFPSLSLFSSGSKSCSLRGSSTSSWSSSVAAFPFLYCVPATSREDAKFLPCLHLKEKNNKTIHMYWFWGFFFFALKILKYLALVSVNFVSQVLESLALFCSFLYLVLGLHFSLQCPKSASTEKPHISGWGGIACFKNIQHDWCWGWGRQRRLLWDVFSPLGANPDSHQ